MARFIDCRTIYGDGRIIPIMDTDLEILTEEFVAACQTAGGNLTDADVRQEYINLWAEYQVAKDDVALA